MPERTVIVIGGGAAGVWAAASASRAGAHVTLIRRARGASAVSSGCVDLASAVDFEGRRVEPELAAVALSHNAKAHPYAALGTGLGAAIEKARAFVVQSHPRLGFRGATGRNLLVATPFGNRKETWLAQQSIARGDLLAWPADAKIGVVAMPNRVAFDADATVRGVKDRGHDAVTLTIDFPLDRFAATAELARLLDDSGHRAQFAAAVETSARAAGATHVLLPTSGLEDSNAVLDTLKVNGIVAAELPGAPPSVPGLRFDRELDRVAHECATVIDQAVVSATIADGKVVCVKTADGQEFAADSFILATGRFIGGGIRHESEFHESVFNLPVFVNGVPVADKWLGDLLDRHAAEPQLALTAGVMVDAAMRPVNDRGRVVLSNLFAAGSVIGGYDPAKEGGGLGVCAVTAVVAARSALTPLPLVATLSRSAGEGGDQNSEPSPAARERVATIGSRVRAVRVSQESRS